MVVQIHGLFQVYNGALVRSSAFTAAYTQDCRFRVLVLSHIFLLLSGCLFHSSPAKFTFSVFPKFLFSHSFYLYMVMAFLALFLLEHVYTSILSADFFLFLILPFDLHDQFIYNW